MLELLDPRNLDSIAFEEGLIDRIRQFSLLDDKRIGWNYYMDYTWIAVNFEKIFKPGMTVLDIGCGPGAIHGYLEHVHNIEILGIDRSRWSRDYVDYVGDVLDADFRHQAGIKDDAFDIIISTSALEHNSLPVHTEIVRQCVRLLKPNGVLLCTVSAAPEIRVLPDQTVLDRDAAERIYARKFCAWDYEGIWQRWRAHRVMREAFLARYGAFLDTDPAFLSMGAIVQV